MTASMGIAYYPQDAPNVIDLIRNADAALIDVVTRYQVFARGIDDFVRKPLAGHHRRERFDDAPGLSPSKQIGSERRVPGICKALAMPAKVATEPRNVVKHHDRREGRRAGSGQAKGSGVSPAACG